MGEVFKASDLTPNVSVYKTFRNIMEEMEFKEESIEAVMDSDVIKSASLLPNENKRACINFVLLNLMISKEKEVEPVVRLALLSNTDIPTWLENVTKQTLPFLKENEDYYFG